MIAMKQFRHSRMSDRDLMVLIDNYMNDNGEASMGRIAEELGISQSKQYRLSLAYREYFPLLRLKMGVWRNRMVVKDEVVPVPRTSQDTLTGA